MPTVRLIAETNVAPSLLASHAAQTCHTTQTPEIGDGKTVDTIARLVQSDHSSTLQHNYFTFAIDDISVYSVYFGLHLASPFYNSTLRSSRFSKMYDDPDFDAIRSHLQQISKDGVFHWQTADFIRRGLEIYADNKERVTQLARDAIMRERPNVSKKYIERNAPKFAQEQLRMFVSMVAPTGLDFTTNLSSLATLWRTAWNPEMRAVVAQMAKCVYTKYPDADYMFGTFLHSVDAEDWVPQYNDSDEVGIATKPNAHVVGYRYNDDKFIIPTNPDMFDSSYFSPKYMNNAQMFIASNVEVSAAAMGLDQRHRTIKRSAPEFTGKFYLPPLLQAAGLDGIALDYIRSFYKLRKNMSHMEWAMVAPYGAMVRYSKFADLNALVREQSDRTCWCTQEEIYHLGTKFRADLMNNVDEKSKLFDVLAPHCYATGKCCKGVRYCGRDIAAQLCKDYFTERTI